MERLKKNDYYEEKVVNGVKYRIGVVNGSDIEKIEDILDEQDLPPKKEERFRMRLLLSMSVKVFNGNDWQKVRPSYFNTIPAYEYYDLLSSFHKINTISDSEIDSEDSELLFEAMKLFGRVDFRILDGLTLPQKEWIKAQILKRKRSDGTTD